MTKGDLELAASGKLHGGRALSYGASRPWRGVALGALWVVLAPVAVYAPKGSIILLGLMILTTPDFRGALRVMREMARTPAAMALGALVLWALVSSLHAPEPATSLSAAGRIALLSAAGLFALASTSARGAQDREWAWRGLCASGFVLAFLLGFEYVSGAALGSLVKGSDQSNLNFANRGSAILTITIFSAAALLRRRTGSVWPAVALLLLAALAVISMPMFASTLALVIGVAVFALTRAFGRRILYAVAVLAGLWTVAAPWVHRDVVNSGTLGARIVGVPASWQHRLGIWEYTGTLALTRPVFGHGFDSARVISRTSGKVPIVTAEERWNDTGLPLHPHSVPLQVWLELGAVGVLIVLALIAGIAAAISRAAHDRLALATMTATAAAAWTIMSLSYGAWQNWWHAVVWICAMACVLSRGDRGRAGG